MHKVVFIYKQKKSDAAWSSSISELGVYLSNVFNLASVVKVDNSSFSALIDSYKELSRLFLARGDLVVVNHAISFWLLLPILIRLKLRGIKIIFLFHEHEHILGVKYCVSNFNKIKFKEYLRHFSWWYKIPYRLSFKVVCLSSYQGVSLGKYDFERLSYLGVDQRRFPVKLLALPLMKETIVLFAHDPLRYDKGDRFCQGIKCCDNITVRYGRDILLDYDKVYEKYHNSDIIFLPSDSESYSLVLAESFATNSCVVTNSNVGIVQLLLSIYSQDELERYGLFISAHSVVGYTNAIRKASSFIRANEVNTIKLFHALSLDQHSSFIRFELFLRRCLSIFN
jgi:glycosyltransferase involved in cell wall biosynthesis